jgi:hypothetical protein
MKTRLVACVAFAVFGALALGSCGSGGGDPGGGAGTTTIMIDAMADGHTDGVTLTLAGISHKMGDDAANLDTRALIRFPLAAIPAGATVVGAFLHISFLTVVGTPAAGLGHLRFVRISGALTLAAGDYAAPVLAHDPANDLIVSLPGTRQRLGLLMPVLSALGAAETHLKLRLEYDMATDFDAMEDSLDFASIAHPTEPRAQLEIVYQNP